MEFLIMVDIFFKIFSRTENLLSRQIFKTMSTHQLNFFLLIDVIHSWNKLPNQIFKKNRKSLENFRLN